MVIPIAVLLVLPRPCWKMGLLNNVKLAPMFALLSKEDSVETGHLDAPTLNQETIRVQTLLILPPTQNTVSNVSISLMLKYFTNMYYFSNQQEKEH